MANEFKIRKGLIVEGATSGTVVDVQGSLGQLFSVTDNLTGEIFAVADISGVPIMSINSSSATVFTGLVSGITPVAAANFVTKAYVDGGGGAGSGFLPLSAGTGFPLTGDLAMNNNIGIIVKDSSGSFRDILKLNSSNILEIGSSALATDTIFKNTGNVGIGTTTPSEKLDVNGSIMISGTTGHLTFGGRNGYVTTVPSNAAGFIYSAARFPSDSSGAFPFNNYGEMVFQGNLRTGYNNGFSWATAEGAVGATVTPTVKMRLTDAGYLGVGTTSPGSKLEVNENSNSTVYSKVFNQNAGVSATARMAVVAESAQLDFIATSAGYTGVSGWADSGIISTDSGASGGLILNAQTGGLKLQTGLSTKMVILAGGNVGIGITNPGRELDVVGVIQAQGPFYSIVSSTSTNLSTANGGQLSLYNSSNTDGNFSNIGGYNSNSLVTSQICFINESQTNRTGSIAFMTHNGSNMPERMRINSAGAIRFNAYGAGTLVTDASGNITVSSGGGAGGPFLPLSAGIGFPLTGDLYQTLGTIGVAQADGDYVAKIYELSADGFLSLYTGQPTPLEKVRISSYGDSWIDPAASGKVGIGTTTPLGGSKLHVSSANGTAYTSNAQLRVSADITNNNRAAIMFSDDATSDGKISYFPSSTEASRFFSISARLNEGDFIIKGDGKVGIGTTNPSSKLEISGFPTAQGLRLNYGNSSGTVEAINFQANGGPNGVIGMQMVSSNVGDLWLGGSGGRTLTLYRDGNVGIGTTAPGQKLAIEGGGTADENVLRVNNQGQVSSRIWIRNAGQSAYIINSGTNADTLATGLLPQALAMGIGNSSPVQFYNGSTPSVKMTIDSSGNVGIGTTTPLAKLDVQGTQGQLFSVTDDLSGEIFAVADISGVPIMTVNSSGLSTFDGNINVNAQILTPGGSNLALNPNTGLVTIGGVLQASGTGASYFTGNLGINNTNPSEKLDVNGNIFVSLKFGNLTANSKGVQFEAPTTATQTCRFDSDEMRFFAGGGAGEVFTMLNSTGAATFTNTVTATNFILSSDERLKENIKTLEPKVISAEWKSFNAKDDESYRTGVIAQELEVKHPEFVETNEEGFKSVKYIDLLISKIAELEHRIKQLEK